MIAIEMFPERDCSDCPAHRQKEYGCDGGALIPVLIDNEQTDVCPRRPVKDKPRWFNHIYRSYNHYKNGMLPDSGGTDHQPYKLMQLIALMDATLAEVREEKEERERKKQARKNR